MRLYVAHCQNIPTYLYLITRFSYSPEIEFSLEDSPHLAKETPCRVGRTIGIVFNYDVWRVLANTGHKYSDVQ